MMRRASRRSSHQRAHKRRRGAPRRLSGGAPRVCARGSPAPHPPGAAGAPRHEEVAMKVAGLTYREIAARGGGILKTVADTRAAPKAELLAATRMRLDGMLRFGTTTAEVKSG